VVFVTANNTLPYDRRVWQEARFVRRLGANVIGISPAGLGPERPWEPFAVVDGIPIHRFKMQEAEAGLAAYGREFAGAFAGTARTLRWLARRVPVDVVHVANPPDVLLPAAATLKRRGTRLVFDHHDPSPEMYLAHTGRRDLPYGALRLLERATLAIADVVIATNESLRRVAIERGRKRPDDVFVVRNGPDLTRVQRTSPDPSLKRSKSYLLGYAGVMGLADGVDDAVRALAALKQRRSDWHAVMVGDGPARSAAQRLAEDLGVADCVEFLGWLGHPDVMRVLSTADVCLAPDPPSEANRRSTMIKVMEYMALERPIVSYDLPESRFSAGTAARFASRPDAQAFATEIDALLDDPEARAVMGRSGRERVERELSWQHSEAELGRAYDRVLAP
jgi:glycosyltransferase involved in cell wall biosynthesis